MILFAADEVGLRITEFLALREQRIDWLVLHEGDRGGFNQAIEAAFTRDGRHGRVETAAALKDASVVAEIAGTHPQLGVLAWWPHLIKPPILDLPQRGWLNLHPGYLPYNRGKHPNFWCLHDETPCGAALHFIDGGVDTGPIVARAQLETTWEDTGETVHRRCRDLAVDLFTRHFDGIASGATRPVAQAPPEGSSHRAGEIEAASEIVLDRPTTARQLLNLARARLFPPHPTAFFRDGGKRFSVQVLIKEVEEEAR